MPEYAGSAVESAEPGSLEGRGETAPDLLEALALRLRHTLDLAAHEAELAAVSALVMVILIVLAAAAIVVGWALLVAIMISLLMTAGLSWWLAALAFAVVHGVVAVICWRLVIRLSRNLTLPALRSVLGRHDEDGLSSRDDEPTDRPAGRKT